MLSIIYITCNRSAELEKSILACEARVMIEHEYVVVDNGSKDCTSAMVEKLIQAGYPIRYLLQEKNYGVSQGRNIGFREANGDICYFIDDDATIISEGLVLDDAYNYMKNNPDVSAMGTDCYDTERKCQLVGLPEKGMGTERFHLIRNYIGCSHFVRKTTAQNWHLYPDNLLYGAEELYAGMAIYNNGGKVIHYPRIQVLHCPSVNTRDDRKSRQRNGHINTYIIKKYYLPFLYRIISGLFFFLRIARFERLNPIAVIKDYSMVKKRFDKRFRQTMKMKRVKYLIKKFGVKNIV